MKKHQKGFTLIELLVVIAIIGILAGVVLTSLNTAREKARDTQAIAELKDAQLIMESAADGNGLYPSTRPAGIATTTVAWWVSTARDEYHMGVALENASSLPSDDADDDSGFDGAVADCGLAAGTGAACYDVVN